MLTFPTSPAPPSPISNVQLPFKPPMPTAVARSANEVKAGGASIEPLLGVTLDVGIGDPKAPQSSDAVDAPSSKV